MTKSVLKALGKMTLVMLAALGLITFACGSALLAGAVSVKEVSCGLELLLAHANYGLGGLGLAATGTVVRGMTPHVLEGVRNWVARIIQDKVTEAMR